MTHQEDSAVLDHVMALLIEHGPGAMANAFATIMNLAMQIGPSPVSVPAFMRELGNMACSYFLSTRGVARVDHPAGGHLPCSWSRIAFQNLSTVASESGRGDSLGTRI